MKIAKIYKNKTVFEAIRIFLERRTFFVWWFFELLTKKEDKAGLDRMYENGYCSKAAYVLLLKMFFKK